MVRVGRRLGPWVGFKQGQPQSHREEEQAVLGRWEVGTGRRGRLQVGARLVRGPGNKGGPLTGHLHRCCWELRAGVLS